MHANDYVTNSILRGEFGFGDGFIISDCNDIPALVSFRVAANLSHAGAKGIKGGVDLDLQCGDQAAYTHLAEAISEGLTTLDNVKRNARRVLQAKFALGLFEKPMADAAAAQAALNTPAHRALALRAAGQSICPSHFTRDRLTQTVAANRGGRGTAEEREVPAAAGAGHEEDRGGGRERRLRGA